MWAMRHTRCRTGVSGPERSQERPGLLEVGGVEALREPVIDGRQQGGGSSFVGVPCSGGLGFVNGGNGISSYPYSSGNGGSVVVGGGGIPNGGGAFGGNGGNGILASSFGGTAYGDLALTLQGGSGGGG